MTKNSTIRQKTGKCAMCPDDRGVQPLIGGMCNNHYWLSRRMKSAEKLATKEINREPGLPELIEEADAVFSRYLRMTAANEKGILSCYICGTEVHYKRAQAMHFVPRGNLFLRLDPRNVRAGCSTCNCHKGGNLVLFAQKLNEEHPGLAEILLEEAHTIYKPSREELKAIIGEYSDKSKGLLKTVN